MTRKTGEFERIAKIFAPLAAGFPGALGLTDDAALIAPETGSDIVVTTDTMVAGVHYMGDEPPSAIACKLLRVNLSDLAAMGATPLAYTLNVALPREIDDPWLEDFAEGLRQDQQRFGIALAGGDSVSTPGPVTLTVTAFGRVSQGRALRRSAARPGDTVYVSGTIGDAALGLLTLTGKLDPGKGAARDDLVARYRLPEPRVSLGPELVGLANAAVDVSDGLVADLRHIAEASHCRAVLQADRVPRSATTRALLEARPELTEVGLAGGDDYEILFTAPAGSEDAVRSLASRLSLALTAVGRIEAGEGVQVLDACGAEIPLSVQGWVHG